MRLTVDFSALREVVRQMGAEGINPPPPPPPPPLDPIDPIDIALSGEGIAVDLRDVIIKSGLFISHGRQVLLYIKNHKFSVQAALEDPKKGRKYHVADCRTLKEKKEKNQFDDRYFQKNDMSGNFDIFGTDRHTGEEVKGTARLKVCKNCLAYLNYKNYRQTKSELIVSEFSIEEFFSTYSSFFLRMPKRNFGDNESGYTADWASISSQYRSDKGFQCESCGVDLSGHKNLLHTHHKNGVKTDNQRSNFQALCIDCHRKQPAHERMFVRHEDMQLITRLRSEQKQDRRRLTWDEAFELADTGVHGVLHLCRAKNMPVPVVGHALKDPSGIVVAQLELAWPGPERKIGVAIGDKDLAIARQHGWQAWSMIDALEQL